MSKPAEEINVALQLPEGAGRVVAKFPASVTLWEILKEFEKKPGNTEGKFTQQQNEADHTYLQPTLGYMTKEISTNAELRSTTLFDLGLVKGSGLFRLTLKKTNFGYEEFLQTDSASAVQESNLRNSNNKKLAQAEAENKKLTDAQDMSFKRMQLELEKEKEIARQKEREKEKEASQKVQSNNEQKQKTINNSNKSNDTNGWENKEDSEQHPTNYSKTLKTTELTEEELQREQRELMQWGKERRTPMELTNEIQRRELEEAMLAKKKEELTAERNTTVFAPPSDKNKQTVTVDNSIYQVTSSDIASASAEQAKKVNESQLFIPKSERESLKEKKYSKFSKCQVKVHFPDRYELSGDFLPTEKLSRVFTFIRENLHPDVPANWLVYTTPPQKILDESIDQNLLQLGYVPAVKLYFEAGDYSGPYLTDQMMANAIEKPIVVYEFVGAPQTQPDEKERVIVNPKPVAKPTQTTDGNASQSQKKMPSWFKGTGK
jgi:chemotaxis protein histidine kinase CheA